MTVRASSASSRFASRQLRRALLGSSALIGIGLVATPAAAQTTNPAAGGTITTSSPGATVVDNTPTGGVRYTDVQDAAVTVTGVTITQVVNTPTTAALSIEGSSGSIGVGFDGNNTLSTTVSGNAAFRHTATGNAFLTFSGSGNSFTGSYGIDISAPNSFADINSAGFNQIFIGNGSALVGVNATSGAATGVDLGGSTITGFATGIRAISNANFASVTMTGGSINATTIGIDVSGPSANVTSQAAITAPTGIRALGTNDVTVVTSGAGTINAVASGTGTGIVANVSGGTGSLVINAGAAIGNTVAGVYGIDASTTGASLGSIIVTTSAAVTGAQRGISVTSVAGPIAVTAGGTVTSSSIGIYASSAATSGNTINANADITGGVWAIQTVGQGFTTTIASGATVTGSGTNSRAIIAQSGDATVVNNGTIRNLSADSNSAIQFAQAGTVSNSGTITYAGNQLGAIFANTGLTVTNSGTIAATGASTVAIYAAGNGAFATSVTNLSGGVINGSIGLFNSGAGSNTLDLQAGSTTGSVNSSAGGTTTTTLAGTLTGAYSAGGATGANHFTLAATGSMQAATFGSASDTFTFNGGTINGVVNAGGGTDTFNSVLGAGNSGSISLSNLTAFENYNHVSGTLTLTGTRSTGPGWAVTSGASITLAGSLTTTSGSGTAFTINGNNSGSVVQVLSGASIGGFSGLFFNGGPSATLNNAGSISVTGGAAVQTNGSTAMTNTGTIASAGNVGIFTGFGVASLTNSGTVSGGASSFAVSSQYSAMTITNQAGGFIRGGSGAILGGSSGFGGVLTVSNASGAGLTGATAINTAGLAGLALNNSGQIIGGTNAIGATGTGVVTITNNAGGVIATGTLASAAATYVAGGNGDAIKLVSGTVTNGGTIDGAAGGVIASGALTLVNTGTITSHGTGTGNFDGVTVGGTASILNSGTITGGAYAAIYTAAGGTITNAAAGQLSGAGSAAMVLDGGGTFNNYGAASNPGGAGVGTGNTAVTINLFAGSTTGSVTTGDGDDILAIYNGRGTAGTASTQSGITLQNAGTLAAASFGAVNLGGGSDTLQLRGTGDGTAANGAAGSFSLATSTGAEILTKSDSGTWTLTGAAVTPGLTINAGLGGTPGSGGLLIFSGTTGLSGAINVNGATIRATSAGAFGTGTINAIDPTIQFGATGTYANNISLASADPANDPTNLQIFGTGVTATLSGAITQASAGQPLVFSSVDSTGTPNTGTFILTNAANNWTGATTINSGVTLSASGNSAVAVISGGNIVDNGTLSYNFGNGQTMSRAISGAGALTFSGGGLLTLTGSNTFTGGTTVSGFSNFVVGDGGANGTITGPIALNNSNLFFSRTGGYVNNSTITGTGNSIVFARGTLTLNGNITTPGGVAVDSSTPGTVTLGGTVSGATTAADGGYGSAVALGQPNNALVVASTGQIQGGAFIGVRVTGQGDSVTNFGSITNTGTGGSEQVGAGVAIYTIGGTNTVTNGSVSNTSATISGANNAIDQRGSATAALTVNNFGTLVSDRYNAIENSGSAGALTVNNTGSAATIVARGTAGQGRAISHGSAATLTVVNSGRMIGSTEGIYSNGAATITNSGTIGSGTLSGVTTGTYTVGGTSGITLVNGGSITNQSGGIINSAGTGITIGGAGSLTNQSGGVISGSSAAVSVNSALLFAINLQAGSTTTGEILSSGTGARTVMIAGSLSGAYNASGGTGIDTVTLASTGSMTSANLGGGNDAFLYQGGSFSGLIDGGTGTDSFTSNFTGSASINGGTLTGFESYTHQAGTLTLTGSISGSAPMSVTGGTLVVDGSFQGATSVANGATLRGSGSVGATSIADGGTLAGTQGGTLTLASLGLNSGSIVNATFSAAGGPALFAVTGDLTLDGTLNIASTGAFGFGIYGLFTYGGALTDNGLALGSAPGDAERLALQTSVAGRVNLVHASSELLFWDGAGPQGNGAINGGSGIWSATNTNWTGADGNLNGAMSPQPGFAIFQAAPGTVTVDNSAGQVAVTGMQFAVNGYRVEGGALALAGPSTIVRVGDGTAPSAAYVATIASVLTGTGGLVKTDYGTLILTANNDYSGGTTVNAGTLRLGDGVAAAGILGSVTMAGDSTLDIRQNAIVAGGLVSGGSGTHTVLIAGSLTGAYDGSTGNAIDHVTLAATGTMAGANLGAGNDSFLYQGGSFSGLIDGGADTDSFTVGIGSAGTASLSLASLTNFESYTLQAGTLNLSGSRTGGPGWTVGSGTTLNLSGQLSTSAAIGVTASGPATVNILAGGSLSTSNSLAIYSTAAGLAISNAGSISSAANNAIVTTGANNSVTNSGTITGVTGTGSYTAAVYLSGANGSVTNNAGGLITGRRAVELDGLNGTVINAGTLTATYDNAISLFAGGSVTNQAGGILNANGTSGAWGIFATGGATTILNAGTINGGAGIVTNAAGATVTNSGTINGLLQGVWAYNGTTLALTNSGAIGASAGYGVQMAGGGSVTNLSGGNISGSTAAMSLAGAGYTIDLRAGSITGAIDASGTTGTNSYTIAGTLNGGLLAGAGSDTVTLVGGSTLGAGAMLNGGAGTDAFILAGAGNGSLDIGVVSNFESRTKTGAGTWTLTGNDSSTVGWQIDAGTLALSGGNAVNDGAGVMIGAAGRLALVDSEGISTLGGAGQVALGANTLTLLNGGSYAGTIGGTGNVTLRGGTLLLSGANSYSGFTAIDAGTLRLGAAGVLADASNLYVLSGAVLDLQAFNETVSFASLSGTVNGTGTLTAGQYLLNGATVNANLGTGLLATLGGTSVLNGTSGAGNVYVSLGTLALGASDRLADTANLNVSSGATLELGAYSDTVHAASIGGSLNGTGTLTAAEYDLAGATINANLGAGALYQIGGTSVLNGTAAAGTADVQGGTLRLGASNRLADTAAIAIRNGAVLDLAGFEDTVGTAYVAGTLNGTGTLTAGEYDLTGATVNAKLGGGLLLQLGGTSVLNGTAGAENVAVQGGTLALGASNRLSDSAAVSVSAGAALDLGANSDKVASLALGGKLDGTGTLTAAQYVLVGATVNANLGTGALYQVGGTSVLNGTAAAGTADVQGGTLRLGASNRLADTAAIAIRNGAVLDLAGFEETVGTAYVAGTLNGTGTLTAGEYDLAGATVNANLGGGALYNLSGTSLLNGSSGATTVVVQGGSLQLGASNRLADGADVYIFAGAALDLAAFNDTARSLSVAGALNGTGTFTAAEYDLAGATINANLGTGALYNISGTSLLNGTANASQVSVIGGTLALGASNRLADAATVAVASGATFNLGANADTVALVALGGTLNGTGTLTAAEYDLTGATVNANLGTGALYNISGTSLLNGSSAAASLGIVAGTLRLGAAERLDNRTDVIINDGGTLDLAGFEETIDTVQGNGSVALGAGRLRVGADNGSSTFAGIISGAGSLEKIGTGLFIFGKTQLYTGGTTVTAGELRLLGSTAGNVTVNGGTFSGTGMVNGRLTLAGGTISPGAGSLSGFQATNFNSTSGNFAIDVNTTQADFLAVTGAATLNGGLVQTNILSPGSQFQFRQLYTILQAGSLTGTFANPTGFVATSGSNILFQRLRYDILANSVVLEIRRMDDFAAAAGSANQSAVGDALNSTRLGSDDNFASLLNAFGQLSPAQQSAALDQMGNEGAGNASLILGFAADRFADLLSDRLDGTDRLLGLATGPDFGAQPSAGNGAATLGAAMSLARGGAMPMAGGSAMSLIGGGARGTGSGPWMKAYGFTTRLDGTAGVADLRTNGRGVLFGLDTTLGNIVLGGAAGFVDFDGSTAARGTETNGTAWQGGIYARFHSGGTFAGVAASYVKADLATNRTIGVAGFRGNARGETDASVTTIQGVIGHDFQVSRTTQLGVLGTVRFSDVDQNAYAETGGGAFNLNHDAQERQYLVGTAMARAGKDFDLGGNLNLNANVRAGIAFADGDLQSALRSTFAGAPAGTGAFSTAGATLPSSWGMLGAGLNLTPDNGRWEASIRYEGRYGSRLREGQLAIGVAVRW